MHRQGETLQARIRCHVGMGLEANYLTVLHPRLKLAGIIPAVRRTNRVDYLGLSRHRQASPQSTPLSHHSGILTVLLNQPQAVKCFGERLEFLGRHRPQGLT